MYFFFSSRRRHTRFDCDWSSDVCSSDLHHRERARADGLPFAADRMDVRRRRARQDRARGLPHARAEGAVGRTLRSRGAAIVSGVEGVGLLHRPYPVRRRRLYGGLTMARARIAVIGAGLMGHGIAQVFAVAGHDVTITDSVAASVDSAKARIATSLKDLGDDERAVER